MRHELPPTIKGTRRSSLWNVLVGCHVCQPDGSHGSQWNNVEAGEDFAEEHWAKTGHPVWMDVIFRVSYVEFDREAGP